MFQVINQKLLFGIITVNIVTALFKIIIFLFRVDQCLTLKAILQFKNHLIIKVFSFTYLNKSKYLIKVCFQHSHVH
jgi:hypothetical protein